MQEQTHLEFKIKQNLILFIVNGRKYGRMKENALLLIQTPTVNELPFTQAPIKQENNVDNYKNRIRHPTEQKPIKVTDLTNVDGEEQPEAIEKRTPILPHEKFVQEKQKKIKKLQEKHCKHLHEIIKRCKSCKKK